MKTFIIIFLGGGLGSMLRYGTQLLLHERSATYLFPWTTFAVNVAGSFLIGMFYALSEKFSLPEDIRLFLTAGLCGGFTTFSTFSNDNLELIRQEYGLVCAVYITLSIAAGILACFLGCWCCNIIFKK